LKTKLTYILVSLIFFACSEGSDKKKSTSLNKTKQKVAIKIERPSFNSDSAYTYIKTQVDFGPRVPNTESHRNTGNYLAAKLRSFNFEVIEQEGVVSAFNNKRLNIKNIIGSYRAELNNRIMLFAHWDTRPFADQDSKDRDKPIDGANDGASGVGVLLEIARQIQISRPNIGVDIFFFDAEDYGQPSDVRPYKPRTWCLGSQYWVSNPHKANYRANYGILLDMIGAPNAVFPKEKNISMKYAPNIVNKVWGVAAALGHTNYFLFEEKRYVGEDDHLYVNALMNIPSIDIIQYDENTEAFAPYWHTHDDNMEVIDKNTLKAVGETVLATVLMEGNQFNN